MFDVVPDAPDFEGAARLQILQLQVDAAPGETRHRETLDERSPQIQLRVRGPSVLVLIRHSVQETTVQTILILDAKV